MARAVVVHGVSCRQGMGDIIAATRRMKLEVLEGYWGPDGWLVGREGYGKRSAR